VRSADIIRALRERGLAQDELARRAGVARETLSRWESGAQQPSFEALAHVAGAAGFQLDVQLLPAEPELVNLVDDQLDLGPTNRLKALLGGQWSACRDALRAVAALGDLAVIVGPVAAALRGAPQRPGRGRVDVLVGPQDREEVVRRLLEADAYPDGFERAPASPERRERWRAGRGQLTMRCDATEVNDVTALRDRAHRVYLNQDNAGLLRVALVEDLAEMVERSPWSEDALYRAGLRAVLASGRYSSRKPRDERLELA